MNSPRRQFLRQKTTFRPRLERLERRDCPSCTVFQKEETLTILGDREANHITIADTREGGISVTCDGSVSQTYSGVTQIDLKTGGGNDDVAASFVNPPDNFQFHADLGAGNDRLSIRGFDPQPDPPLVRVSFDILAGAGNDGITARFSCPSDPSFHFRADLGAGDDRLNVLWDMQPGDIVPPDSRPAVVSFDILAGAGNDRLDINLVAPPDTRPWDMRFRADLGAGDDRLNVLWDMQPGEAQPPDARPGDIVPPDSRPAAVSFDILAGAGNDRLDFNLVGPPDIRPWDMRFRADLGAGDDTFMMNLADLNINGDFVMSVHGGAGDDRIALRVELDEDSSGALDFRVLGGAGNDNLTLAIDGLLEDPSLLAALLDGGRGFDTARVTRNVRIANCEEVIFLDEPR